MLSLSAENLVLGGKRGNYVFEEVEIVENTLVVL